MKEGSGEWSCSLVNLVGFAQMCEVWLGWLRMRHSPLDLAEKERKVNILNKIPIAKTAFSPKLSTISRGSSMQVAFAHRAT